MPRYSNQRAGLTLVELLVVVVIITFLAALTALYFPRYQEGELLSRGADQLQGWLAGARQQAMRDGVPTGIEFRFVDGVCRELVYIQQPDDFAQGRYVGSGSGNVATFSLPTGITFGSANLPVQVGDYLELMGGGQIYRIAGIGPNALTIAPPPQSPALPGPPTPSPIPAYNNEPTNYRFIPAPRVISGEQSLVLPDNIGIMDNGPVAGPGSQNLPFINQIKPNKQILFSPSGAVIGEGTSNGQIIFWLKHLDPKIDNKTLITVQPRTGFIAAHPVSSGPDPYEFTKDARSSGM